MMRKYNSNIFRTMRVENIDNEPWFCAADIGRAVGLKKANVYVRRYVGESHIQKVQEGFHEVLMVDTSGAAHLIEMGHLADEDKAMAEDEIERIWLQACKDFAAEQEAETEQKCCERNKIDANAKINFEEEAQMQGMQIFKNPEFGEIRTEMVNGEPWFCLSDVCKALLINNPSQIKTRLNEAGIITNEVGVRTGLKSDGTPSIQKMSMLFVNEANLYKTIFQSRKESAERFTDWVTSEVLPSIRKTGGYQQEEQKPMSTFDQIKLLASGTMELAQRVTELATVSDKLETEVGNLKNDMPLYGCESDEISQHVRHVGTQCLGGKNSNAYHDKTLRSKVYIDIYAQLRREFGYSGSYKAIKRKYISAAYDLINNYKLPATQTRSRIFSKISLIYSKGGAEKFHLCYYLCKYDTLTIRL